MQLIVVALALSTIGAWGQDFENPFDQINADYAKGTLGQSAKVASPPVVAALDVAETLKNARAELKDAAKKSSMANDQFTIAAQDYKGSKVALAQRHAQEAWEMKKEASDSYKKGADLLEQASKLQTRKIKVTVDDEQLERDAKHGLDMVKDQEQEEQEAAHEVKDEGNPVDGAVLSKAVSMLQSQSSLEHFLG